VAVPLIKADRVAVERRPRGGAPRRVLTDIALEASAGELVLVLGRPGSGKTTLLEALAGLLPLNSGTVFVSSRGAETLTWGAGMPPREVRERVGLLFQFPERQLVGRTAREDVLWGDATSSREVFAARELRRAGLQEGLWDVPVGRLSRGEKRRVALAGLLARRPKVLLLDEPAVGLDTEGQALVGKEIAIYREGGGAVVLATHWPEAALPLADRVICLEGGRLLYSGDSAGLLEASRQNPLVRGLLPFSWRLRRALESGDDLPAGMASCRDAVLGALTELVAPPPPDQRSPVTRNKDS